MSVDAEVIQKQVKTYIKVYVGLLLLTVLTVAVAYVQWTPAMGVLVALLIAGAKAALVSMFFMHLKTEKSTVYYMLLLTIFMFLLVLFLPLFTMVEYDFG
jgi:cytochrome c oxidase subunit 4